VTTTNPKVSIPVFELADAAAWERWVGPDDVSGQTANIIYGGESYVFLRFDRTDGTVVVFNEREWVTFVSAVAADREPA
jgi:hypothetical protein